MMERHPPRAPSTREQKRDAAYAILDQLISLLATEGVTDRGIAVKEGRDPHGYYRLASAPGYVLHLQAYPGFSSEDSLEVLARVMNTPQLLEERRRGAALIGNEHGAVVGYLPGLSAGYQGVQVPWSTERLVELVSQGVAQWLSDQPRFSGPSGTDPHS